MKELYITEEQKNNLCKELAQIYIKYHSECIFFSPYSFDGQNILHITIVFNEEDEEILNKYNEEINKYNKESFDKLTDKFGINIYITMDSISKYDSEYLQKKYERLLFNSIILYDRNDKFIKLKDKAIIDSKNVRTQIKNYDNLITINPSFNDSYLSKIMWDAGQKRYSEMLPLVKKSVERQNSGSQRVYRRVMNTYFDN